jgi:hypothetical protein
MNENGEDISNFGSISDDDPLNNLIDDLYYLKCSLIKNYKITRQSFSYLEQISNLLESRPELSKSLLKWKFLEKELLYFLRGQKFKESLKLATKIIEKCRSGPELYFTRKFLFFITEKLYKSLKESVLTSSKNKINNKLWSNNMEGLNADDMVEINNLKDLCSDDLDELGNLMKGLGNSNIKEVKGLNGIDDTNAAINKIIGDSNAINNKPIGDNLDQLIDDNLIDNELPDEIINISLDVPKIIMSFIKELILIKRSVCSILNDLSFFELANSCISLETVEMFNAVFKDISFPYKNQSETAKNIWVQDGLYEVRRPLFDPEIVFRNKNLFVPHSLIENLCSGVFDKIYNKCLNLVDFADISFIDLIDMLLYKKISYFSSELELLLLEGKNPKAFLFYRRSLEIDSVPNEMFINCLVKAIENSELCRNAVICLFYYLEVDEFKNNYIKIKKLFTESKIRAIFECLEFNCGHECLEVENHDVKSYINANRSNIKKEEELNICVMQSSFDSNLAESQIFGNTYEDRVFQPPSDILQNRTAERSILNCFSEFGNFRDLDEKNEKPNLNDKNSCERNRILQLIKHLYSIVRKEFFYKPSYLILLSFTLSHIPEEYEFISGFFKDFLIFCKKDSKNIARIILPANIKEKKIKTRKIEMDDDGEMILENDTNDFYGIENILNNSAIPAVDLQANETDLKDLPGNEIESKDLQKNAEKTILRLNKTRIESDESQ